MTIQRYCVHCTPLTQATCGVCDGRGVVRPVDGPDAPLFTMRRRLGLL